MLSVQRGALTLRLWTAAVGAAWNGCSVCTVFGDRSIRRGDGSLAKLRFFFRSAGLRAGSFQWLHDDKCAEEWFVAPNRKKRTGTEAGATEDTILTSPTPRRSS
jgi:hypothetical protein